MGMSSPRRRTQTFRMPWATWKISWTPPARPSALTYPARGRETMQTAGGWSGCRPGELVVVVRGPEAGVALTEGILERVVQYRRAHIEEGLRRGPAPTHLLPFVHA